MSSTSLKIQSDKLMRGKSWVWDIVFSFCWFGKQSHQKENVRVLVLRKEVPDRSVLWLPAAQGGHEWLWHIRQHRHNNSVPSERGHRAAAMSPLCNHSLDSQEGLAEPEPPWEQRCGAVPTAWVRLRWEDALCSGTNHITRALLSSAQTNPALCSCAWIECTCEGHMKMANEWSWVGMLTPGYPLLFLHLCSFTFTCLAVILSVNVGLICLCARC